jgi:hypothetical protein
VSPWAADETSTVTVDGAVSHPFATITVVCPHRDHEIDVMIEPLWRGIFMISTTTRSG